MRSRFPGLVQLGTWLSAVLVLAVAASLGVTFALNAAADDLRLQAQQGLGQAVDAPRTFPGAQLSTQLTADVPINEYEARLRRADALDHRAERISELMAVGCLAGLLTMLLTLAPRATRAVANTTSKGSV